MGVTRTYVPRAGCLTSARGGPNVGRRPAPTSLGRLRAAARARDSAQLWLEGIIGQIDNSEFVLGVTVTEL